MKEVKEMNEQELIEERKKKLMSFFRKNNYTFSFSILTALSLIFTLLSYLKIMPIAPINWLLLALFSFIAAIFAYYDKLQLAFYSILAWVVWIALYIRTRNLPGLRDVTTGGWTLGPDLDPFLFLRWAKYIVEHGALYSMDMMRYVPLGFNTNTELVLLSYMIAWFHKIAILFGSTSVEHSAVLFPVFMFGLTVVAFYFFNKIVFQDILGKEKASIAALIASLLFSLMPSLLPRTIAGIPEKESAAFLFLILSLTFFVKAWKTGTLPKKLTYSLLAGISTAVMALVWGGFIYVIITIGTAVFIAFILGQADLSRYYSYCVWLLSFSAILIIFSERFSIYGLFTSINMIVVLMTFAAMSLHLIIYKTKIGSYVNRGILAKIPRPINSFIIASIVSVILASVFLGPSFILGKAGALKNTFIRPLVDRLNVTVAENKQPYFIEWVSSFGPVIKGLPLTFWIFIIGSIYLFYLLVGRMERKERIFLTGGYAVFLFTFIFSRYSNSSILNGENFVSISLLLGGALFFVLIAGRYYYKYYKNNDERLKSLDFALIMFLVLFGLCLLSARSAIRLIMTLVLPASSLIALLIVGIWRQYERRDKVSGTRRVTGFIFIIILALSAFSAYILYQASIATAQGYVPSSYTQQWQKAMGWVRENTPGEAAFSHWWDYGYWVQTMGERATMVDGGNAIGYWNYLVGRHALTGESEKNALEMLYAHNVTYFIIDSSDIGKYTAFSSIGSDENYDKRSWINIFVLDPSRITESKNKTTFVYLGGFSLDEDVIYNDNGTKVSLPGLNDLGIDKPRNLAALGAILLEIEEDGNISQPKGIFVYNGNQYTLPLRYAYHNGKLIDFGTGIEAGIFLMPQLAQNEQGFSLVQNGALLYLSKRTVNSLFARLYLYGEETDAYKIAHIEDDVVVNGLKQQNIAGGDFVYYGGVRGPIKIWKISYPDGMAIKKEYLSTDYPTSLWAA